VSVEPITTERLELIAFEPEAIRHLIRGERNLNLPREFPSQDDIDGFLSIQLHRMEANPDRREWMARLMVTQTKREVIGHCGFHGPPEVIGRAEIGYTVFEQFRGQGFAKEAAKALVQWAFAQGEKEVYASVSPDNAPSLAVVRSLGFKQVGTQVDEVDGLELVFAIAKP
jgi:RimJ/RimL family protein N-acetyltransferase